MTTPTKGAPSFNKEETYYLPDDFALAPKLDAHIHYNTIDAAYLKYADSINMKLLTINVDIGFSIEKQLDIAQYLKKRYPALINFIGTFDPTNFAADTFADDTIRQIKKCMDAGARGIKIWKNIGMILQDSTGKYVMADDPVFAPVLAYLEKEQITLATHLGEPRNCWLPYHEITMDSDVKYYKGYPEYYMYQHPDAPSYEQQIAVRDRLLDRYPKLNFIGMHWGSLEWDVDKVAERFDKYPEFSIDISGRMGHLQLQTIRDREKVRSFFHKYQDRIMYGSDLTVSVLGIKSNIFRRIAPGTSIRRKCNAFYNTWQNEWLFLATDMAAPIEKFNMLNAPETLEGLHLPKHIVDKICYENACKIYDLR